MNVIDQVRAFLDQSIVVHLRFDFYSTGSLFYSNYPNAKQTFFVTLPPPDVILQALDIPVPRHIDAFTVRRTLEIYHDRLVGNEHRVAKILAALKRPDTDWYHRRRNFT